MELSELRVHDLLRLPSPDAVSVVDPPFWLTPALQAAPWVVVRRSPPRFGRIAVGIRGASRDERCAAYLDPTAIRERVTPEALVARQAWRQAPCRQHALMRSLACHADDFTGTGLSWGIAGGAGFELATGAPVLTAASDLDLVVHCGLPLPARALRAFAEIVAVAVCRVDVLVETPRGGFALAEFMGGSGSVLLRQPDGARLVACAGLTAAEG